MARVAALVASGNRELADTVELICNAATKAVGSSSHRDDDAVDLFVAELLDRDKARLMVRALEALSPNLAMLRVSCGLFSRPQKSQKLGREEKNLQNTTAGTLIKKHLLGASRTAQP